MTHKLNLLDAGTVIDHIPEGLGLKLASILRLKEKKHSVFIGLHLKSHRMGKKDMLKINQMICTKQELDHIYFISPYATLNEISDGKVIKKKPLVHPERLEALFICPNSSCITHEEKKKPSCIFKKPAPDPTLCCYFCQNQFTQRDIE